MYNLPLIIAVSGKAFSGKDTFFELAKELEAEDLKVTRFAFGDEVKKAAKLLGWDGNKDEKGRSILTWVGDGAREFISPTIWVDKVIDEMEKTYAFSPKRSIFIVTDCRYPWELQALQEYAGEANFLSIRIIGKNNEKINILTPQQRMHLSEVALDSVDHHLYFTNDFSKGLRPYREFVRETIFESLAAQQHK